MTYLDAVRMLLPSAERCRLRIDRWASCKLPLLHNTVRFMSVWLETCAPLEACVHCLLFYFFEASSHTKAYNRKRHATCTSMTPKTATNTATTLLSSLLLVVCLLFCSDFTVVGSISSKDLSFVWNSSVSIDCGLTLWRLLQFLRNCSLMTGTHTALRRHQ